MAGDREQGGAQQDFYSNPLAGIASGLLSAGGPSYEPQSLSAGLSRGLGYAAEMARKQKELASLQKYRDAQLAISRAAEQRLAQKQAFETDPLKKAQYINSLTNALLGGGTDVGSGAPSDSDVDSGAASIAASDSRGGIDLNNLTPQQRFKLSMAGIKIPESTQQKEAIKLGSKQQEVMFEHNLKRKETIEDELPSLIEQLRDYQKMYDITQTNPGLFGAVVGKAAGWRNDPNVGIFKDLQQQLVARTEKQFSSRGSNQALKSALSYKADFGDPLKVAQGKLKSSMSKVINQIKYLQNRYKKFSGGQPVQTGYVILQLPDGRYSVLSEEEYKQRGGK